MKIRERSVKQRKENEIRTSRQRPVKAKIAQLANTEIGKKV